MGIYKLVRTVRWEEDGVCPIKTDFGVLVKGFSPKDALRRNLRSCYNFRRLPEVPRGVEYMTGYAILEKQGIRGIKTIVISFDEKYTVEGRGAFLMGL